MYPLRAARSREERHDRTRESCARTAQDGEATPRDLGRALDVEDPERLGDLPMRFCLEREGRDRTCGTHDDVGVLVGTIGHARIQNVRHVGECRFDLLIKGRQTFARRGDAQIEFGDLRFAYERFGAAVGCRSDRGSEAILLGLERLDGGNRGATLRVELEDAIDELCRAAAAPRRDAYALGIAAKKSDIQHDRTRRSVRASALPVRWAPASGAPKRSHMIGGCIKRTSVIGFVAFASLGWPCAVGAAATTAREPASVSVVGHGEVKREAEIAYVTLSIISNADTAPEAATKSNAVADAMLAALKKRNLTAGGLANSQYQLDDPSANSYGGQPRRTGFYVTRSLEVVVPIADLGAVIDDELAAGASGIGGIRYGLTEESASQARAAVMAEAVSDARRQAESAANVSHLRVLGIRSISVTNAGLRQIGRATSRPSATAIVRPPTNIPPPQVTFEQTVTVVYDLIP